MAQTEHEDKILIDGCIKHNRKEQFALFNKYKNKLYTVAVRIMGSFEEAEDVLQEAFIIVFKNLESFRYESSLYSWMRTILVNTAIRTLKRNQRLIFMDENHIPLPKVEWKDNFTSESLNNAIAELPASARTVFVLVEIEGYKHQEVAELLNVDLGTSKSQLFYAKKLLKKKLAEYSNG